MVVKHHYRPSKIGNIYISRRYKILYDSDCVVELVFKGLIKARIRHDFTLYLSMKKVQIFEDIWSVENLLFWVVFF